jgi:cysteinyl-tRNA synthetase
MALKVYNTLNRKKEEFKPMQAGKVNMFVCGPTVYDYCHLGHAKTYIQFDFIAKCLRKMGYSVFYLQNITDIDDKIIRRAREQNTTPAALALKFEASYLEDMAVLHNNAVDKYARATEHMTQIVKQVKALIEKGFAYKITDGYYFDLKKFTDYGKLSGRNTLQDDDAVSRIDENPEKKNKGDFCLWKFHKEGEPFWETEIGKGRPGWHIEDTAISEEYFGQQYDLHGGGIDLMFPHHEAELAQQESASGKKPFVRYWMHTAFLNIKSEKMSKSKGNFFTIKEALKEYDYAVLRYFFISSHYRTALDFTPAVLEQSKNGLERMNEFIRKIDRQKDDQENERLIKAFKEWFYSSLEDDFDTPGAFAHLYDFIRELNAKGNAGKHVFGLMKELNEIFDFLTLVEEAVPEGIMKLVQAREDARKNKDWKESDRIRDEIKANGWIVEDKKEGQKVKKA